ncbi:PRC-barrel domain-containing protein [Ramlibacter sp. AN1015]|uniref:PRC-barrel domain-containing protein n=1 Tax=Ramlibacter sp. AN1015 TaxID=3133428 RepID=UPI0030BA7BF5
MRATRLPLARPRSRRTTVLIAASALLIGAAAHHAQAQTQPVTPGGTGQTLGVPTTQGSAGSVNAQPQQQPMGKYQGIRANEIIGMPVRSEQQQKLGEISDLLVDMQSGDIRYAILQFDRGIFSEEARFAVPLKELQLSQGRDVMVYPNMSRARLADAAIRRTDYDGIWGNNLLGNRDLWGRIDRAWGVQQPTGTTRAMLASTILDKDVDTAGNDDVGEIETLVVNLANSRVHYVVMEFDPGWLAPERKVALPITAFQMPPGREDLILSITRERAAALRELDRNWFNNLNNPEYVADMDRYLLNSVPGIMTANLASGEQTMGANADLFGRLDTDKDGSLNRAEFDAVPELGRHWNAADGNSDGRVSREEFSRFGVRVERR